MHSLFWEVGVRLICASTQVRASRHSYSAGNHQINISPAASWGRIIHTVFCKMVFLCIHTAALWNLLCTQHKGDVNMKQKLQVEPVMVASLSFGGTLYDINMQHGFKCLSFTRGNIERSVISPMKSWFHSQIRWSRPTNSLQEQFLWSKSLRCVSDTSLLRHIGWDTSR